MKLRGSNCRMGGESKYVFTQDISDVLNLPIRGTGHKLRWFFKEMLAMMAIRNSQVLRQWATENQFLVSNRGYCLQAML